MRKSDTQKRKTIAIILIFTFASVIAFGQREFVHPGLSHKLSDLQRMKYMVESGKEPWLTSFNNLLKDPKASYDYIVQGDPSMTTVSIDGESYIQLSSDVKAAYLNAIMWAITGDVRHAEKAVEIFKAWSNLTEVTGGGTESLNAGRVAWQLVEAAELIKSTYDGWGAADIIKFQDMLVYPGYSSVAKPASVNSSNGTFYWRMYNGDPGRHGNQDLFGFRAVMAIGVFLDNDTIYDRALRYIKGMPHRSDDIPYASGPGIQGSLISTNEYFDYYNATQGTSIEDYGYNGVLENFIWENGQCQESSRDQDHAILGVGMVASVAEMAWNQGDDIYSYLDNRILKGYEWALHYNVSYNYSFDDQQDPWEPTVESGEFIQRQERVGRWYSKKVNPHYESDFVKVSRGNFKADRRPIYEMAIAHFGVREGLPDTTFKWTKRALDISNEETGYEKTGWTLDHLGWGGLTMHRPDSCAGDPCTYVNGKPLFAIHKLPGTIEAEDYDFFSGTANGRTYHDGTAGNSGGQYRTDDVDIETCSEGGYNLTDIEDGEWLSYIVFVPVTSTYDITIRYSAENSGTTIKFASGPDYVTNDVAIPFGGGYSTGADNWSDFTVGSQVTLNAGVQSMRFYIGGTSNLVRVNSISIVHNPVGGKDITLNAKETDGTIVLNWTPVNIIPDSINIYRSTTQDFGSSDKIASNISGTFFIDNTIASGIDYYYWVEIYEESISYQSDSVVASAKVGFINADFDSTNDGWLPNTFGATEEVKNGQLVVQLTEVLPGKYRGDIMKKDGAVLHAGYYPILAIKMQRPESAHVILDANIGSYGNGHNQWTGTIGDDIYYYDFANKGFGASNYLLPTDDITSLTLFQFKVADITTGEKHYVVDWIKSFTSLEELQAFAANDTAGTLPVTQIGANNTQFTLGDTVQFTDYSSNYPTEWLWDFGDGTTSTEENPTHIYKEVGYYTVSLKSSNKYGADSAGITDYIYVIDDGEPPVADFSVSNTDPVENESVDFTDLSLNSPTEWSWNFGDGNKSTEQNPNHSYRRKGDYTVILIASNLHGTDTLRMQDYIHVTVPVSSTGEPKNEGIQWKSDNMDLLFMNLPGHAAISIYSITGKLVTTNETNEGEYRVHVPQSGIYISVIRTHKGTYSFKIPMY